MSFCGVPLWLHWAEASACSTYSWFPRRDPDGGQWRDSRYNPCLGFTRPAVLGAVRRCQHFSGNDGLGSRPATGGCRGGGAVTDRFPD